MGKGWKEGSSLKNEGAVRVTPAYFCARLGEESLPALYGAVKKAGYSSFFRASGARR